MRILILGNNRLAWWCVRFLREQNEDIVGLVLHPPERRKFGEEIARDADVSADVTFDAATLHDPATLQAIRDLRPDIGISILFDYLLRPEFMGILPGGVVNLHPSYLPYNRGQYPNVWSIVEGTPAGVTLHYIDNGVDSGDIISQRKVPVQPTDTGATLYDRLERSALDLFRETWPVIRAGAAPRFPQPEGGTYHRTHDVDRIDEIDLERTFRAGELIDVLRARTFPPYRGAYFRDGDRKVYLRLQLLDEDDLNSGT